MQTLFVDTILCCFKTYFICSLKYESTIMYMIFLYFTIEFHKIVLNNFFSFYLLIFFLRDTVSF